MRNTDKAPKSPAAKKPGGGGKVKSMKHQAAVAVTGKQPPLKVVHISNPMRVNVSPSEFRGLVQELTGRNAVDWPHHPRWNNSISNFTLDNIENDGQGLVLPPADTRHDEVGNCLDDVGVGIGCCVGSDLAFHADDFISSYFV